MRAVPDGAWGRKYPPLLVMAAALVLTMFALPSALNLPQANPSQTLEYAPVPGDRGNAPPGGALSSLGLGTSSTAGDSGGAGSGAGAGLASSPVALPLLSGAGGNPSTKQCVGNPPRQTEDPLSPPCVAFFNGDNGGSTYPGVTRSEVRILFYFDGGNTYSDTSQHPQEKEPVATYFDLGEPPQSGEFAWDRALRVLQAHFNDRYQTYGRRVHFYTYYSSQGGANPTDNQSAEAAANYARIHPFAVFNYYLSGSPTWSDQMSQRGVLNFGGTSLRTSAYYQRYPRLSWGFAPSVDQESKLFASYICSGLMPHTVSYSGNGDLGQPRKYGLLYTTDQSHPELQYFSELLTKEVADCGLQFAVRHAIPEAGFTQDNANASSATSNMADFKAQNVTTVIWPGGYDTQNPAAAARLRYYPEWLLAGDGRTDGNQNGAFEDPQEWQHAWVMTPTLPRVNGFEPSCRDAVQTTAPGFGDTTYACRAWDDVRQLFTGLQVAGPRLSPATMDQGFHAIPARESTDPDVPACFYETGDYTCVKDAIAEWWDGTAPPPVATDPPGCWRIAGAGRRHVAGGWPGEDVNSARGSSDTCNSLRGGVYYNLSPPG
ncbi:MAG: hypothetical protein ACYDGR_10710 [Candidatus Dormibacteria bacterium]